MGEPTGPRLRLARDATGQLVGTSVLGLAPEPFARPLECPDRHCAAPVAPVREHARTDETGTVTVSAHFRLAPGAHHAPGCIYDPVQTAAAITAASGGAVRKSAGQLRLLLPNTFTTSPKDTIQRSARSPRRNRSRPRTKPDLSHVISSAAAIQQFLDRYPDDDAALQLFHADAGTQRIPWRDFCLGSDPARLLALAQDLAAERKPRHLIAIHGTITGSGAARTGTTVYVEQDLHTKIESDGRRRWLYVRLRTQDPRLTEPLALGRRFIAIGDWELFNPDAARVAELALWVRRPWQVSAWDADTRRRRESESSASADDPAT